MMKTPLTNSVFVKRVGLLTACFSLLVVSALSATEKSSSTDKKISGTETETVKTTETEAKKEQTTRSKRRSRKGKRPITKPKFDPNAKRVELFDGMKEGQFAVKVIAKNAKQGHVLIENTTDKPLTVQLPKSFVAVHVLKQYEGGGGGEGGGGYGGGGEQGGGQQGGGQAQGGGFGGGQGGGQQGGGAGGGGYGGGQGGGGGQGFFSIPPEKVIKVEYHSVCLAHGKPEPSPRKTYILIKVEQFTKDPNLQMLIELVGMNRIDPQVAQAAAWNLTDKMSWRTLAAKQQKHIGGRRPTPYFSRAQVFRARQLVALAVGKVKEKQEKERNGELSKSPSGRKNVSRRRIR